MASKRSKYELELELELQYLKEETQRVIAERQKLEHEIQRERELEMLQKEKTRLREREKCRKAEAEKQRIQEARKIAEAQKELDDIRWYVEHLKKVNAEIAAENKQEEEMRKRLEAQPKTAAFKEFPEVFPACVVTRSVDKKSSESARKTISDDVSLEDSFFCRLVDEKTCTKETDTCTQSKENDTNTNTCTHEDKQTHDMSDKAQIVDECELMLNKSSLIESQKDCEFVALNESALSEDETQTQFESKERSFDPGEVLILLPIPGDPLRARGSGPCVVEEKVSDVDYVIRTPDRQGQKRLCRVNTSEKDVESNPSDGATPVFGVVDKEVEAVQSFPPAATKKELMRFLKMAGFYRRFCHNFLDVVAPSTDLWKNARFSDVVAPLTDLRTNAMFQWSAECQTVFDRGKAILYSGPVLGAPDSIDRGKSHPLQRSCARSTGLQEGFSLAAVASGVGAGAVLTFTRNGRLCENISMQNLRLCRNCFFVRWTSMQKIVFV